MLLNFIRFLRGYVTFKITGAFPERFINLAIKNGIGIFNTIPQKGTLTSCMVISDYRSVRPIARRCGVRLRIISRHGLPFITYKFRYRWGIAAGAALFLIISLIMQNFVWSIEINGVETLSETELKSALYSAGFSVGRFKGALDLHKTERELLLKFDKIGWMSINLIGAHAEIEIKEKASVPQINYSSDYNNIVAIADGIILSENVKRGTSALKVGSAVSKGQLLVSGMYENALGDIHFVDADAEIIAATEYEFTATCDEAISCYQPVKGKQRTSVNAFWADFPVTFACEEPLFTSFVETKQVFLYDNPIPLSVNVEHLCIYRQTNVKLDKKQAKARLKADLALYKLFNLNNAMSIVEQTDFSENNGIYCLSAQISCTEDIAVKEKLIVNQE